MNENLLRGQLFEIRRGIARAGAFEGYRATPVALSGALALAAGGLQRLLQPSPLQFVTLWVVTAGLGFGINVCTIARTYGTSPRHWERSLAFAALLDLTPAVLGGALLTAALSFIGHAELLPAIWMVLFGTGVLASRRHMPRGCAWVGVAYLLAGTATLVLLPDGQALQAGVMAGVFGLGQLTLALVLRHSAVAGANASATASSGARP